MNIYQPSGAAYWNPDEYEKIRVPDRFAQIQKQPFDWRSARVMRAPGIPGKILNQKQNDSDVCRKS